MMQLYNIFVFGFTCPYENNENNPNGLYANPDDCSTFYQCSNGEPYLLSCPDDLQWNQERLVCDYPENVGCRIPY
ncbi:chondroitin proteoglycan 2-like isoform X2 [Gigaspora margarita]|uniref:Chondroitin proteoglycan 2-like isoform X2 n=1 Tax=Gigaspora margarita TaxID=4874 RepID=A0A8H4AK12_GIGMA|nr:chondroitin proteoglycan 2-like isoform X2 [Gigaspora margarita]